MIDVPAKLIESLHAAGLATTHKAYGVVVFREGQTQDGLVLADPALFLARDRDGWLGRDGDGWTVSHQVRFPTPGPGDFVTAWATAEEAVADILDFFVLHPERSLEPARLRAEHAKRKRHP